MSDHIVRALSDDGGVRLFFAESTELVQRAHVIHGTSKTMTAALGRALTGAALMGCMLKDRDETLTLQFRGNGPAGKVICTSDYMGNVRGCVGDPGVELPPNSQGKLDVGGAIGKGALLVIRGNGKGEPYVGTSAIVSGEIAEDITEYYAKSEQIPTVCALGVRCGKDCSCTAAGGFILQVLPGADDATIDKIEENLTHIGSISELIKNGNANGEAEKYVLDTMFSGIGYSVFDEFDIGYICPCSRERFLSGLKGLVGGEREKLIAEGRPIETRCMFCGAEYVFDPDELVL